MSNSVQGAGVLIRPAATLLMVRDTVNGIEVLALQRSKQMRFLPGHIAFPGGTLDVEDWETLRFATGDTVQAGQHPDDVAYASAALRECAEEIGWLCAIRGTDGVVHEVGLSLAEQAELLQNQNAYSKVVQLHGSGLAYCRLRFVGRWVTPPSMPARFDTRFFLYVMTDPSLVPSVSQAENDWAAWIRPVDTLEQIAAGAVQAVPPTIAMLRGLNQFESTAACVRALDVPGPQG